MKSIDFRGVTQQFKIDAALLQAAKDAFLGGVPSLPTRLGRPPAAQMRLPEAKVEQRPGVGKGIGSNRVRRHTKPK